MEKDKIPYFKDPYYAKNVVAKVKFSYSKTSTDKSSEIPFAIEFTHSDAKIELWDLNAFRPDFRDYKEILKQLSSEKGLKMIVLYENIKYTDKKVMIPRFIVAKGMRFVNVR